MHKLEKFFEPFPHQTRFHAFCVMACFIGGAIWGLSFVLPPAVDWHTAFRPAALSLLSGRSPYYVEGFFNPVWALAPLLPIAILPEQIGRATLFVLTLSSLGYVVRQLGAGLWATLFVLLSPPAIHGILNGNIDWLVALGVVLPPRIGLFFVTVKPQIGFTIVIFWVVEAWKNGGSQEAIRLTLPFMAAALLSLLLFGLWPLRTKREITLWWNASLWPMSIPVGFALLVAALRQRNINYAMGASPCLSPYVLFHSWIVALLAIVNSLPELVAAVAGLWVLVILRAVG